MDFRIKSKSEFLLLVFQNSAAVELYLHGEFYRSSVTKTDKVPLLMLDSILIHNPI